MGCSGGHSRSIYARFLGKKRTSREKGVHYYIQTRHNDLFSHCNLFLGKLKEKLAQKASVHILSEYIGWCSWSSLLNSNKFNMAAVSVKRSLETIRFSEYSNDSKQFLELYGK